MTIDGRHLQLSVAARINIREIKNRLSVRTGLVQNPSPHIKPLAVAGVPLRGTAKLNPETNSVTNPKYVLHYCATKLLTKLR